MANFPLLFAIRHSSFLIRLPTETEWEAAMGGRGDYPWGKTFDPVRLNCADSWAGRDLSDFEEWRKWLDSESRREASLTAAGLTAVTTYPQGVSLAGVWDGCGNAWEWSADLYDKQGNTYTVRGGAWDNNQGSARVPYRLNDYPGPFSLDIGFRCVVAPVFS